jgi:hypothetical protein
MFITLLLVTFYSVSNQANALSKVTATIDKNPAMINESVLLTVTADDDINRNALDTSPLLGDFMVGQTSVSTQTNMVNFKTSRSTTWQVILVPRKTGKLLIPALTIEQINSDPIELTVVPKNTSDNMQADIFITSELSHEQVYVQQLSTLTLKLHFAVELKSGNLSEPELTGATFEKVGKDKQSDSIINGKRYRVIEQTYAITPEESGDFTIAAPLFSGDVLQSSQRRSSFLSFAQTKPVTIIGEVLTIKVLPIPESYPKDAPWLPTDILTLHQEWQATNDTFTVGEPITRTITLTAAGLSKAQLPKLTMPDVRGVKIYPDQAESNSTLNKNRLVSQKRQNFALVPSTAGQFTLPAMSVTWFNTLTNKVQQSSLPAKTILVEADESSTDIEQPTDFNSQSTTNINDGYSSGQAQQRSTTEGIVPPRINQDKSLQWLFLGLWLFTSLAWLIQVMFLRGIKQKTSQLSPIPSTNNHLPKLLAACKNNNAELALNEILPWLRKLISQTKATVKIHNIAQATGYIEDQAFATALNDLQQHLYGKCAMQGAPSWQGATLALAIEKVNKQFAQSSVVETLSINP